MFFLIYINDISLRSTKSYADDTVLFAVHLQERVCHEWLCRDLNILMKWFCLNKLTIHLDNVVCNQRIC